MQESCMNLHTIHTIKITLHICESVNESTKRERKKNKLNKFFCVNGGKILVSVFIIFHFVQKIFHGDVEEILSDFYNLIFTNKAFFRPSDLGPAF